MHCQARARARVWDADGDTVTQVCAFRREAESKRGLNAEEDMSRCWMEGLVELDSRLCCCRKRSKRQGRVVMGLLYTQRYGQKEVQSDGANEKSRRRSDRIKDRIKERGDRARQT